MNIYTLETIFSRTPQLVSTDLDDEMVIMDDEKGSFYGLNATAKMIYGLLETPKTLEEIIGLITAEYDVSPEQCQADIIPFLQQMVTSKLLGADIGQ
jgi:hypothetical protein